MRLGGRATGGRVATKQLRGCGVAPQSLRPSRPLAPHLPAADSAPALKAPALSGPAGKALSLSAPADSAPADKVPALSAPAEHSKRQRAKRQQSAQSPTSAGRCSDLLQQRRRELPQCARRSQPRLSCCRYRSARKRTCFVLSRSSRASHRHPTPAYPGSRRVALRSGSLNLLRRMPWKENTRWDISRGTRLRSTQNI
ncbi:hypothetical protein M2253_001966 [Leucobacter luti]|nr:hypothetical protein [Leucobacter luti]